MTGDDPILLAHGAGGRLTRDLIRQRFVPRLDNPFLAPLSDAAVLDATPPGRLALATDAFVVDPPLFPGGDIGYLSVCGTVNDLAVAGAKPLFLTWALILEEGLDSDLLETVVDGAARAARQAGIQIVAGDTKVVPRGKGDGIFVTTAGLGVVPEGRNVGDHRVTAGDVLIASGPLGDHGATIMALRHGIAGETLLSDAAPLTELIERVFAAGTDVHAMHDPTRGGLATVCHEVATQTDLRTVLDETSVPVRREVAATCELLGLDPLYLACEGRVIFWAPPEAADRLIAVLHGHPLGAGAAKIGHVETREKRQAPVILRTTVGSTRPIDLLSGADLPRIC